MIHTAPKEAFSWVYKPCHQALFGCVPDPWRMRFVGGCVRNGFLEHKSKKTQEDFDLATAYLPHEIMSFFQDKGHKVIPTGIDHGTVTVLLEGNIYEITTLRKDVATDGRWAQVVFTDDWSQDAARRDLTFNALYLDHTGTVYDPVQGLPDLAQGIVRFIGDPYQRIQEDFLRIVRFFRFWAWYGRSPDPKSLQACAQLASGMSCLAGERLAKEMHKLMEAPDVWPSLQAMAQHGILPWVLHHPRKTPSTPSLRAHGACKDIPTQKPNISPIKTVCAPSCTSMMAQSQQHKSSPPTKPYPGLPVDSPYPNTQKEKKTNDQFSCQKSQSIHDPLTHLQQAEAAQIIPYNRVGVRLAVAAERLPERLVLSRAQQQVIRHNQAPLPWPQHTIYDALASEPQHHKPWHMSQLAQDDIGIPLIKRLCAGHADYPLAPVQSRWLLVILAYNVYTYGLPLTRDQWLTQACLHHVGVSMLAPIWHWLQTNPWPPFPLTGQEALNAGLRGSAIQNFLKAGRWWWADRAVHDPDHDATSWQPHLWAFLQRLGLVDQEKFL